MKFLNDTYVKNISILFTGNVLAQIIPFALAPIITRIFTPQELGIHGNFVALATLISIVANGRLELALILPKNNNKATQLLKLGIKISTIVSIVTLSLILFKKPIEAFYKTQLLTSFLPLVSITIFVISTHNLLNQWLVRLKLFYSLSIIKIILSLSTNSLFVILGWLHFGISGLIYGYIIGFILATVILLLITRNKIDWFLKPKLKYLDLLKEYKEFPIVNSLHAFTDILFQDVVILAVLTQQFGLVTTGLYVIMMKYLKAPVRFIGNAIGQVFYPEANESFLRNNNTSQYLKKSLKLSLLVAVPILCIVLIFGPELFNWYLGDAWLYSGVFAQIMIIPIAISLLTSPISSIPLIYGKQKTSFYINLIGMSFSAFIFYILCVSTSSTIIGLMGLASTQSLLYIVLLVWYYNLSKV